MKTLLAALAVSAGLVIPLPAFAGQRTVTLAVQNMYCAACPYIVEQSLEAVPGVSKVVVSFRDKTATVTYDDARTDISALVTRTTNAGYPSSPES